jgi:hypothetical protein
VSQQVKISQRRWAPHQVFGHFSAIPPNLISAHDLVTPASDLWDDRAHNRLLYHCPPAPPELTSSNGETNEFLFWAASGTTSGSWQSTLNLPVQPHTGAPANIPGDITFPDVDGLDASLTAWYRPVEHPPLYDYSGVFVEALAATGDFLDWTEPGGPSWQPPFQIEPSRWGMVQPGNIPTGRQDFIITADDTFYDSGLQFQGWLLLHQSVPFTVIDRKRLLLPQHARGMAFALYGMPSARIPWSDWPWPIPIERPGDPFTSLISDFSRETALLSYIHDVATELPQASRLAIQSEALNGIADLAKRTQLSLNIATVGKRSAALPKTNRKQTAKATGNGG